MATLWNPVPIPVFNPSTGERAGGALAYFYVGGTTTPLAVYTADDGTTPHTWPVVADSNGVFPPIFIPYGTFGYRVITANGTMISPNVQLVQNPAPASSGGGGSVPDSELFKTGDRKSSYEPGPLAGWVRENGRTIGNAGSGATERANDDTGPLFVFHWNLFPNNICPVSGGRGSTAEADFAAGKTLQLINASGTSDFGVDNMGSTAANRLQASTTITTTNASATATVGSAAGLIVGMTVISEKVPAGTTITAITGTTVTLSSGVGVTAGTTQPARFSLFGDAEKPGQIAGAAGRTLTAGQLPANIPNSASSSTTVTAPSGQVIMINVPGNFTAYAGGAAQTPNAGNLVSGLTASTTTTVSINPDGGQAHAALPPALLVYKYIKL